MHVCRVLGSSRVLVNHSTISMNAYQTSCGSFWSFLFLGSPFLVQNLNGHLTEAGSAGGDQSKSSDEEEGSLPWCVSSFSPSASECQDPYSVLLVWITTALATGAAAYLKSQRTSEVCACARACVCLCACLCALVYVCVCVASACASSFLGHGFSPSHSMNILGDL